tara:strand:- start:731 stop:1939 length:1209 start_codon:yes stop_codon:yes gene_type:complete
MDLNLNNQTSLEEVFLKRLMYDILSFNKLDAQEVIDPPGIKDFWRLENILYGKVSSSLAIIQPNRSRLVLIPNQESSLFTFQQISERFLSFQGSFKIPSQSGRLAEDNYLNSPEIFRGYVDADQKYNEMVTNLLRNHNIKLLQGNGSDQIRGIKDYARIFFETMLNLDRIPLITKSSYILSNKVSAINSGMSLEIADLNPSDNKHKQEFIQSQNFEFYRQTAINNGFIIDKNIPWRMNYDLSSPVTNAESYFINDNFTEVRNEDLDYLISTVVVGYNSLVNQSPRVTQGNCKYSRLPTNKEVVLADVLPPHYWIKRYCQVRNKEASEIYTKSELKKIIQYAIDLNDINLTYVSSKFRLPYLFEGSTVYQELKKYYLEKNNISLDNFSEHVKIIIKNSINKIY